jgi:hypothetical protein
MTVSTFTQPDYSSQSGSSYKAAIDGAAHVHSRIAGPFAPHSASTPDMKVYLDAGAIPAAGALPAEVAAQDTGTLTAPSSDPRKDIVYIDRKTGVVGVAAGTEDPSPSDPAVPSGKIAVARINWTAGMTEITNADLDDLRALSMLGLGDVATADFASQAEAEAGTDNAKATTSLRVAQAIAALLPLPSQAEAEAGIATTPRSWSAERVAQAIAALAGGGIAMSTQVFTASGTYTKPAGLLYALVFVTGGGGAGANDISQGCGGGGGTAIKLIAAASIGSTETVTIGSGGTPSGGNGGTSSLGSLCSATGGTGNITTWRVAGGTGSGGDVNLTGEYGYYHATDTDPGGGGSFWGWAGSRGSGTQGNGTAGLVYVIEFKEA